MKEENKIYLRKRLMKVICLFAILIMFGVAIVIYTLETGNYDTGALLMILVAIPIALVLCIYVLMLNIKADELEEG